MNNFDEASYQAFLEAATEKYDFAACKSGEKMTFGKCQKVGDSKKKDDEVAVNVNSSLKKMNKQRNNTRFQDSKGLKDSKKNKKPKKNGGGTPYSPSFDSLTTPWFG